MWTAGVLYLKGSEDCEDAKTVLLYVNLPVKGAASVLDSTVG